MSLVTRAAMMGALAGYNAYRKRGTTRALTLRGSRTLARVKARRSAMRYRPRTRKLSRRGWQARARRQVAAPRNYSTAKTQETVFPTGSDLLQQRLAVVPLLNGIDKGTEINERMRDTIVVSGIKMDMCIQNRDKERVFVNWAVIHPKQAQTITPTQDDFFRDYTSARAWNAGSAAKTGLSWSVAQINTDDYVILKRGKFLLAPGAPDGTPQNQGVYNLKDCEKSISHWIKLGRQFTFTDEVVPVVHDPLYFVMWTASAIAPAGNNVGDNGVRYKLRAITYFREPKTG